MEAAVAAVAALPRLEVHTQQVVEEEELEVLLQVVEPPKITGLEVAVEQEDMQEMEEMEKQEDHLQVLQMMLRLIVELVVEVVKVMDCMVVLEEVVLVWMV